MLNRFEFDQCFDLDGALAMPEDSTADHQLNEAEARPISPANVMFVDMPTVVMGGGRCAVCMKGFRVGGAGAAQVSCGHVFHVNCIAQWVSVNSSCPLCRARMSS